jgi:hypothetical protein
MVTMLEPCPHCRGLCTVPIVYGKPTDLLVRAAERGLVTLAGCAVETNSPTMKCLDCQFAWRSGQACGSDTAALAEVRAIVGRHRNAIFVGMVAESLFSDIEGSRSMEAYLRLRDLLGVQGALDLESVLHVQRFAAEQPESYARLLAETQAQIAILVLRRKRSLFEALFGGAAVFMLASPMSRGHSDEELVQEFWGTLQTSGLNFE